MNAATKSPPSVGDLLASLATQTGTLVRQEVHLASTEMGHKVKNAVLDMATILMGGALIHAGFLALVLAAVVALAVYVPPWISAVAIGGVTAIVGYAFLRRGLTALQDLEPAPKKTLATLSDDKSFLEEQFR
jgi:uncharacterized membrane protein YqjE